VKLGEEKWYTFVGTTAAGCNAFFVRDQGDQSFEIKFDIFGLRLKDWEYDPICQ
jgi:hypothetical protein